MPIHASPCAVGKAGAGRVLDGQHHEVGHGNQQTDEIDVSMADLRVAMRRCFRGWVWAYTVSLSADHSLTAVRCQA